MAIQAHETVQGDSVYGPGTYIDKTVLSVPEDAQRILKLLASRTPGFNQDPAFLDTVKFEGRPTPMIPGPLKAPVLSAALHAMCGLVANELLEIRDGTSVKDASVTVNTDHAGMWLGKTFTAYVNGEDISTLARRRALSKIFDRDFEQGFGVGPLAGRATALYPTKDYNVWYQLHGSLDASKTLKSMGIDMDVPLKDFKEGYDYIREHIQKWSPDELEMHNVRHGLCGSICYSPGGWRETEMGKRLAEYPLVNYTHESYARPTPAVPLPILPDRRPLAGIKVLEMVRIIAGPTVGVTLASLGADVIRVNCSKLPDLNALQLTLNAGKRTVDLDISKESDMTQLKRLLEGADVFVQGFRYGSLDRKGLGLRNMLDLAAKRNKGLIYVDENCYGPAGPFAERPGWQQIGDAASGASYVMGKALGYDEGTSVLPPLPISDMTTGIVGALATLLALRDRARHGGSYHVVSSLVAGDTILVDPEVGLYPVDVVQRTLDEFQFDRTSPDQFVSEIMIQVIDGWKRVFPEYVAQDSPFMTSFESTPWGRMEILKPVAQLGDEPATPHWSSPPVPICQNDGMISWA
ncbi:CoA-transferase family III [Penicillium argentinense]|uniref:CoA-transferase family III n=1 Tax=Penicillium argentinense TaxID=1131581 RepID=A0A9W9EZ25_9EURO|nr:CoA-transferase family III [Penicillium argentinense]KAJ5090592.1 CoA-transferase family III [Penicillium argentinense]